ncbi:MAG: 30S ribosomal protein S6 [Nitrospirota bacterium]|nr:30S ribosomal protein S6 [Nitrospirota bacterium]
MNFYECVLLLKSSLTEEESAAVIGKFQKIVEDKKGTVHAIQRLGKKRMAYELKKERKADYVILYLALPNASDELEVDRTARLDERVLKSMIVKRKSLVLPTTDHPAEAESGTEHFRDSMDAGEGEAI